MDISGLHAQVADLRRLLKRFQGFFPAVSPSDTLSEFKNDLKTLRQELDSACRLVENSSAAGSGKNALAQDTADDEKTSDGMQHFFGEEELLKIRRLESIGILAGGIAHDFNNLLTGITTNLFMARMSAVGRAETCSFINEAEKAAFKATNLAKQLLSFAKGGPSIKETASVKQLVEESVGFSLSGSNVDYRLDLPDDLAPVEVDKGQINQALNNLILNAAQAMPDGGTVWISARNIVLSDPVPGVPAQSRAWLRPGAFIKITIKDEGVGIPREHLDHIFDPFFTTKSKSSGLGLSTAYSIIKKHGGHILAESTEGSGSTFTVFLPAAPPADEKNKNSDPPFLKGSGRILIMDDDTIVRTVVETLLKKAGFEPVCAASGEEALQKYRERLSHGERFLLTIMDLTIPGGMGGKETVKKLREIDPAAKVIVFSGYSTDPVVTSYAEFGFSGVLHKPFNVKEFMRTIAVVLEKPSDSGTEPSSAR